MLFKHLRYDKQYFSFLYRYGDCNVALTCGEILRNCIENEKLCAILLYHDEFYQLLRIIQTSNSEISMDAFRTFEVGCVISSCNSFMNSSQRVLVHNSFLQHGLEFNYKLKSFLRWDSILQSLTPGPVLYDPVFEAGSY